MSPKPSRISEMHTGSVEISPVSASYFASLTMSEISALIRSDWSVMFLSIFAVGGIGCVLERARVCVDDGYRRFEFVRGVGHKLGLLFPSALCRLHDAVGQLYGYEHDDRHGAEQNYEEVVAEVEFKLVGEGCVEKRHPLRAASLESRGFL